MYDKLRVQVFRNNNIHNLNNKLKKSFSVHLRI